MSAAAVDRAHVLEVELAMELTAIAHERQALHEKVGASCRVEWSFVRALREAVQPIVEGFPGGRRMWALVGCIAEAVRAQQVMSQLDCQYDEREISVATRLAGLLDGTNEPTAAFA